MCPLIPSQTVDSVSPNAGMSGPGRRAGGDHHRLRIHRRDRCLLRRQSTSRRPRIRVFRRLPGASRSTATPRSTPIRPLRVAGNRGRRHRRRVRNGPADHYSYFDPPTVTNVDSPQDQGATGIAVTGTNFSYPGVTPLRAASARSTSTRQAPGRPFRSPTRAQRLAAQLLRFRGRQRPHLQPAVLGARRQLRRPGDHAGRNVRDLLGRCPYRDPAATAGTDVDSVAPPTGSTSGWQQRDPHGHQLQHRDRRELRNDDLRRAQRAASRSTATRRSRSTASPRTQRAESTSLSTNPGRHVGRQAVHVRGAADVDELDPPSGSTAGGNNVSLTGTSFNTATDVIFGTTTSTVSGATASRSTATRRSRSTLPRARSGRCQRHCRRTPAGTSASQPYTRIAGAADVDGLTPPSGSTAVATM